MVSSFADIGNNDDDKEWVKISSALFYKMKGDIVLKGIVESVRGLDNDFDNVFRQKRADYGSGRMGEYLVRKPIFVLWSLITSKGKSKDVRKVSLGDDSKITHPRHLYLVQQPHGLVKVGISKDFPTRLNNIESDCGMPMKPLFLSILLPHKLAWDIEQAFIGEHSISRMLQKKDLLSCKKKKVGEWFFLDDYSAIESLLSIIKKEIDDYNDRNHSPIFPGNPSIDDSIPYESDNDLTLFSALKDSSWEDKWKQFIQQSEGNNE